MDSNTDNNKKLSSDNKKKSNILLIFAIIAASLIVIWIITIFDRMDNPGSGQGVKNNLIKQTIAETEKFNLFDLLYIEKNYT